VSALDFPTIWADTGSAPSKYPSPPCRRKPGEPADVLFMGQAASARPPPDEACFPLHRRRFRPIDIVANRPILFPLLRPRSELFVWGEAEDRVSLA